jgi:miniconductance mechanosensitive channel
MNTALQSLLKDFYRGAGFSQGQRHIANEIIAAVMFVIVIFVIWQLSVFVFQRLPGILRKTGSAWMEALKQSGFLRRAARLVPAITAYLVIPAFLSKDRWLTIAVERTVHAFIALMSAGIAAGFLDAAQLIYQSGAEERAKRVPIKGYLQLLKIFLYVVGGILAATAIVNVSPFGILSGIGALSAVLMLVFKDLIVGFVSSVQLSFNDMIRIGDVIEMPKYGAEGSVIDITLQSVVVRNFDMTICTVPIYSLVSDSFRNWRGVANSAGRRVKRSLYIDMQSIHFLKPDEIEKLSAIPLLSEYISSKIEEINAYNSGQGVSHDAFMAERRFTNLGMFRAYTERYLKSLPIIAKDMPFVVRQLQPEATGIPIELYFFCSNKVWENYEQIQADIFDHLLAIIKEFGLCVCQSPNGMDLRTLAAALNNNTIKS